MTTRTILLRSLRHYWRTHLGVALGAALGALVLTGALLVGDSVKATLRRQAENRVGKVQSALLAGDRYFRSQLAGEISPVVAPVLLVRGSVARTDGKARVNQAQVLGVTPAFWALGPKGAAPKNPGDTHVILNSRLAAQLGVKQDDTLIIRIEKPSNFSKDAPLSGSENETIALRLAVGPIADETHFGNFSLQANQVPPFSIFISLELLEKRLGLAGGANLLLSGEHSTEQLREAVTGRWQAADASLQIRGIEKTKETELRTGRVFLDPPVVAAAPPGVQALTYLVNEIRAGEKAVPYSMATAVDTAAAGLLATPLAEHEAAISQWTADDLGVGPGAKIVVKYFVMGERRQLEEKSAELTVREVIPMTHPKLDDSWMPDFPGLSDKKNCREWEPGFEMDTTKIRDQDEKYWDQYKGTPKVILSLPAGQKLWSNRWGNLTSIRYSATMTPEQLGVALHERLTPEQIGMSFLPLREQAFAATKAPVDFGQLFLSFSFFLLAAAAVLTGLLFVFALEQRNEEAGLLLALGWRPRQVRWLLLGEGAVLAIVGSLVGLAGALGYTHLVLLALGGVWSSAVGGVQFAFAATPATIAIGFVASVLVALGSMWVTSRRQLRHSARELLASAGSFEMARADDVKKRSWSLLAGLVFLAGAVAMLFAAARGSAEIFFGAGGLLLLAGIAFGLHWLRRVARAESRLLTLNRLGERNAARRRGRSVATIAVLASGVFMVVAVDSFRQKPSAETALDRRSGTGGFALLGESALPIYEDLNSPKARESFGLDERLMTGVSFVPFRVRAGDDASCLNLNRALQPRLLGVKADDLIGRQAFRFNAGAPASWEAIIAPQSGGEILGIVDAATLQWALQMKLGDTLKYLDERGAPFKVKLVATVAGSILQGSVVVAENRLIEKYPSQGGYRMLLIDAPRERQNEVAQALSRALEDRGLEVTPTARRLAEFQAVENTYLSIFQALGGLGLLLGSAGLAIVVARNVLERRREFGLLGAVGFRPRQLRRLVFAEHRWLIACGLLIGAASALVAVWPSLRDSASGFPLTQVLLLLAALTLGALFWTWLATRLALRGEQIAALRTE